MKRGKKTWTLTDKEMNALLRLAWDAQASYSEKGWTKMAREAAELAAEIHDTLEDAGFYD